MIIFLYFFIVILWSLFLVEFLSDHMLTIGKENKEPTKTYHKIPVN